MAVFLLTAFGLFSSGLLQGARRPGTPRRLKAPSAGHIAIDDGANFNISLAARLADLCEASYHSLAPAGEQPALVDATLIEQRELPSGASYFVACDRTTAAIYVVFRGTANIGNVFSDLNVALLEMPWLAATCASEKTEQPEAPADMNGIVKGHAGFVELYLSLRPLVLEATLRAQTRAQAGEFASALSEPAVYATGHSLGGALATLFALDMASTLSQLRVYSFGSPRVGDEAFARSFDRRVPNSFRYALNLALPCPAPSVASLFSVRLHEGAATSSTSCHGCRCGLRCSSTSTSVVRLSSTESSSHQAVGPLFGIGS